MKVPTALAGAWVHRTAFDRQVRLSFRAGEPADGFRLDAELVIETPFRLRDADGRSYGLEPGTGVRLAPVLALFERTVTTVGVRGRGELVLGFDDGAELRAGPDSRYESWQLTGRGVDPVLVGPGGEDGWEDGWEDGRQG